jgi:hypothetical protein
MHPVLVEVEEDWIEPIDSDNIVGSNSFSPGRKKVYSTIKENKHILGVQPY